MTGLTSGDDRYPMIKSLLNLALFAVSGSGFVVLVLIVYLTDKGLAGRLAIDLALIFLGGSICRFGLDLAIIQRSDKNLRFGFGHALFVVPLAALLYSLVVLPGVNNVGLTGLTVLVTTIAFNEILAAHLRNYGLQVSIYLVRIIGFLPGFLIILSAKNIDSEVIRNSLLVVNIGIILGLYTVGYLRIKRNQTADGEKIKVGWLVERFTLFANLNSMVSTLLAKVDILVFATMLPDSVIGDYSIIKQTLGVFMFVAASFNYRYASEVRRLWKTGSPATFKAKFRAHSREAVVLTAVGLLVASAALTIEFQLLDLNSNILLLASLIVAYGVFAISSVSGMYLTAMDRIGFQTIRLVGSLVLFFILALTVNAISAKSTWVLMTYSASIATIQLLMFASLVRLLSNK
jgi:O-antigen/teichoic acid export membrane protein